MAKSFSNLNSGRQIWEFFEITLHMELQFHAFHNTSAQFRGVFSVLPNIYGEAFLQK